MTLWRYAGLAILTLALLLAVLVGLAPTWLRLGLALYGVDDVRIGSFDIGLNTIELEDIEIGSPAHQSVDAIRIDYTLGDLISGHVDRVTVEGASARMNIDDAFSKDDETGGDTSPAPLPAAFVDELIVKDSRIDLETPMGVLTLPISGRIARHQDQVTFGLTADGAGFGLPGKEISANLALEGALPLNDLPILDRLAASGTLSIDASNASITGFVEGLDGAGHITFTMKDGKLEAATEGFGMTVREPLLDTGQVQGPWTMKLGRAGWPLQMRGDHRDEAWHLAIGGPLEMAARPGTVTADLDAKLALDDDGRFKSLDHGRVALDAKDLSLIDGSVAAAGARLDVRGKPDAIEGALSMKLEGLDWSGDGYALEDASLDQALVLAFDGRILNLSIVEHGRIAIGKVAAADQLESGWFTIRLHPGETPAIRFSIEDGAWQHQLDLEIDPVRLETPSGQWWARVEDLSVTAAGDLDGVSSSRFAVKQGRADWPTSNLAFAGIESEIRLTPDGMAEDGTVPLVIRSVRPLGEPKLFAPLRLDAELAWSEPLVFEGRATTRAKPAAVISFSGHHQQATGGGALTFNLPDLTFDPNGLQPADLSPAFQDVLEETSGQAALAGDLAWGADGFSSNAEFLIKELGLSIGPARLERVNTLLRFDSLAPPTMPPGQELAIALLDVGLPLTDGVVSMQLGADGKLAVDRLTWRFADGEVQARPFTFGSDVQDLTMVLDVDQLDLNGLLGLTRLDGLSGEGRIDGELPLTIGENGVLIADGKLRAATAGILRYQPDETPGFLQSGGESIGLMLQALENFHYDELDITLDGRTDGETDIGLHIRGANPELYDGYPIEFNLDLKGDLANIVQTNLSNYQIPDRIRERLQGFGQ